MDAKIIAKTQTIIDEHHLDIYAMYDVIIIGGGPAGYRAAEVAGKRGKRTLLVEEKAVGGTCLHEGCIPMKAYLHICDVREKATRMMKDNILQCGNAPNVNLATAMQKNRKIIDALKKGIMAGLRSVGVDVAIGKAKISSASDDYVSVDVEDKTFRTRNLIIATGSAPISFPAMDKSLKYRIMESSDIFTMEDVPKSIYIIGSGAIGLEAASFFSALGADVTVAEALPHICDSMDKELSKVLQVSMEKRGIHFLLNTRLEELATDEVSFCSGNDKFSANPDCVLIAVGRKPLVDGLGLENIAIDYDKSGIVIDEHCCTSHPLVYACGDVTGKLMLAHTAYRQAEVAVDSICGIDHAVDYNNIPRIIYSLPTFISVGFSEEYCQERGIKYLTKSLPLTYNGKYYAENGMDGAKAKIMIDTKTHQLLGFHAVGLDITELSLSAEIMIKSSMRVEDILNLIFPHPTFGEIIKVLSDNIA